ncbi:hypothetical protein ABIA35_008119 [Catenulispora sp. MAP12-49]|uniref:hypothetical protein n=1 Tax=Catenulispora sp. MAP12-49 TaxID=3156302 RepID=UPI00351801CB
MGSDRQGEQGSGHEDTTAPPDLVVSVLDGAPDQIVDIGLAYWQLESVDKLGVARWTWSTRDISTEGLGAIQHVAAAGVRALVPGEVCRACGDQLAVRTRSDFSAVLAGGAATCVDCDPKYIDGAEKARAVFGSDRYQKTTAETAAKRVARDAEQRWNAQRRQVVNDRYKVSFTPDKEIPRGRLEHAVALLTILWHGPTTDANPGLILPLNKWRHRFTATADTSTLVNELNGTGLIRIHPLTAVTTFLFEPATFADAWSAANGEVDKLAQPQLANRYFPEEACFYVPFGTSMGTAVARMDDHLSGRLRLKELDETDRLQLLALLADAIADEAVRYFDHQIDDKSLPPVPEQHRPRLREAARKAAGYMSLGRLYCQAWRAVRDGAVAAQRHGMPNSPNMTTHAVNRFEDFASDKSLAASPPFGQLADLPIAGMTRTLFHVVLDADPFDFTVDQARALLAGIPVPDDGSWAWPAAADRVMKSVDLGDWDGQLLRDELERMRSHWGRSRTLASQTRVAEKFAGHYDVYAKTASTREAAMAAVEIALLTARAGADDATAAQAVLLGWDDALAEHRGTAAAQTSEVDDGRSAETDADDKEAAVQPEQDKAAVQGQPASGGRTRSTRKSKKKRRR